MAGFQLDRRHRFLDKLEEAGLLGKAPLPDELRNAFGIIDDAEEEEVAKTATDDEEFLGALSEE
jgi:hypothetical protein